LASFLPAADFTAGDLLVDSFLPASRTFGDGLHFFKNITSFAGKMTSVHIFFTIIIIISWPLIKVNAFVDFNQRKHLLHLRDTFDIIYIQRKGLELVDRLSFGKYLVQLREKQSISQRRLAELAGLNNSTISRIESGSVNPDPATLEKFAKALNIDKALLLTKCGYSEIPEEFVVIARKAGELSEEKRAEAYKIFNETIDNFLSEYEDD